jgi:hypothetical protein
MRRGVKSLGIGIAFLLMSFGVYGDTSSVDTIIVLPVQEIIENIDAPSQNLDYLDVVPPIIEERKLGAYPWVFIVAVCILLLIGLIRAIALPFHRLSLVMAFSNITNQYEQNDKEVSIHPILVLQAFVSAIIITLAVFVIEPFQIGLSLNHDFRFFSILLLAVCLVYCVKYFIHYLVGIVLQSEDLAKLMVVGLLGMLYTFTLISFPLIVTWYYVPDAWLKTWIGLVLLGLTLVFLIWRLVKSTSIYYRYFPFAKIYIIIYLCALEITPLLIIGKLISEQVN